MHDKLLLDIHSNGRTGGESIGVYDCLKIVIMKLRKELWLLYCLFKSGRRTQRNVVYGYNTNWIHVFMDEFVGTRNDL